MITEYEQNIKLDFLDANKLANSPKVAYTPVLRGQSIYLRLKCKEAGIRVEHQMGSLMLFSKKKAEDFVKLIKESLEECKKLEPKQLTKPYQQFKYGRSFLALAIKEEDLILTTEEKFKEVVLFQFSNKIPVTQNYTIYNTFRELKQEVENNYRLLI